mmetsp:Transcript_6602/g.15145  ORF Transcript_6602/g.15145 Transcript_6602/m.15145 type:complete len:244 (-) Transcript_6602:720-1451(-)
MVRASLIATVNSLREIVPSRSLSYFWKNADASSKVSGVSPRTESKAWTRKGIWILDAPPPLSASAARPVSVSSASLASTFFFEERPKKEKPVCACSGGTLATMGSSMKRTVASPDDASASDNFWSSSWTLATRWLSTLLRIQPSPTPALAAEPFLFTLDTLSFSPNSRPNWAEPWPLRVSWTVTSRRSNPSLCPACPPPPPPPPPPPSSSVSASFSYWSAICTASRHTFTIRFATLNWVFPSL